MHSIPGELSFLFLTVNSQAHIELVFVIGKYPSSCLISLFSYGCRDIWSLLLHQSHVNHIFIYIVSRVIRTLPISASTALRFRRVLPILAPLSVYFPLLSYVPLPNGVVSSGMNDTFTLVTARYNVLGIFILGRLPLFG